MLLVQQEEDAINSYHEWNSSPPRNRTSVFRVPARRRLALVASPKLYNDIQRALRLNSLLRKGKPRRRTRLRNLLTLRAVLAAYYCPWFYVYFSTPCLLCRFGAKLLSRGAESGLESYKRKPVCRTTRFPDCLTIEYIFFFLYFHIHIYFFSWTNV